MVVIVVIVVVAAAAVAAAAVVAFAVVAYFYLLNIELGFPCHSQMRQRTRAALPVTLSG